MSMISLRPKLDMAKAMLSAELLKSNSSGEIKINAITINEIHNALESSLAKNSRENVKAFKGYVLKFLTTSQRARALGKYLVALSVALPEARRKLRILYNMSDILYHVKERLDSRQLLEDFRPYIPDLFCSVSDLGLYDNELKSLTEFWSQCDLYDTSFILSLNDKQFIRSKDKNNMGPADIEPFFLGSPDAKYFDLPVSAMCANIRGLNPIVTSSMRPVKIEKSAVAELSNEVAFFYSALSKMDSFERKSLKDEPVVMTTYEGWTTSFFDENKST
ncbi:uncharacterized protein V1510DRAFT_176115 [Dipodascopsis tothii]|uniref:uncharacterized protein n=1 Tax=Dipodascopsis tothii TaxID=44089 RepID=UPI0034CFA381